jgi:hypothetical protein
MIMDKWLKLVSKVYEQSRFATETGAAIHIGPNSHGVLKKLGIQTNQIDANLMEKVWPETMFR